MAASSWVWEGTSTAGGATISLPYPVSGVTAGDIPIIVCVSKATTGSGEPPAISDPTGFTKIFEAWGGTGTAGAGTGPVKLTVWRKTTDADGTENGTTVSVTNPANSSMVYCNIHGVRRATAGSTIEYAFASGQDSTSGTSISVTCGSDPGIKTDDLVLVLFGLTVSTSGATSAEAISATGCTFGTLTERDDDGTTSGNDVRRVVCDVACTAGTSSAAPVITGTSASASQSGVGAVLRIREITGHNVNVLQASETDTAQALGRTKSQVIGQALETDTAGQITPRKSQAVAIALETDTAGVLTVRPFKIPVGQALEADTATALGRTKAQAIGQALESDTGGLLGRSKSRAIGQALEADSSMILGRSKARNVSQATETDTSQPVARSKSRATGQALEVDLANPIALGGVHNVAVNQATEMELAQPVSKAKLRALVQAVEVSTALTLLRRKARQVEQATETDLALPIDHIGGQILGPWTQPAGAITSAAPAGMVAAGARSTISPVVVSGGAGSPKSGSITDATPRGGIDDPRG